MSTELWNATVTHIGDDAPMMFEEGVIILFGEPVPPALADVALVHSGSASAIRDIAAGDTITIGGTQYTVDSLGEIANSNLAELGHIVLYVNQPDQDVLPGAVMVTGPNGITPAVGDTISIAGQ